MSDLPENRSKLILIRRTAVVVWIALLSVTPLHITQAATKSHESFVLNLKDVDIHTLIQTVSEKTGKNFIVDPRVKATVTVISSEPVDAENLYNVFLSVLDVHGFAAVESGSVIKIVPSAIGVQNAVPVQGIETDTSDELQSQVIYLENSPAQQMVEALRPLLPQSATISAENNSNTIVVTDRTANINKLVELIRLMDSRYE